MTTPTTPKFKLTFKDTTPKEPEDPRYTVFGSLADDDTLTVRIVQTNAISTAQPIGWAPKYAAEVADRAMRSYVNMRSELGLEFFGSEEDIESKTADTFLRGYVSDRVPNSTVEMCGSVSDMDSVIRKSFESVWLDEMMEWAQVLAKVKY